MRRADSFKSNLRNQINDVSNTKGQLDLFVVQDVDKSSRTLFIKRINSPVSYKDVMVVGFGSFRMPRINDVVICGFLMNSEQPICFGKVRDIFSNDKEKELEDVSSGDLVSETKSLTNSTLIRQDLNGNIYIANSLGSIKLRADGKVVINETYELPLVDGSSGQVLKTDGAGVIYWADDITSTP